MIGIIYGPGGAGKSRYQVGLAVAQLRETQRNVVTNLALNVPKLAAWMEKTYPGTDYRVAERIRILNEKETEHFWEFRGNDRCVIGFDAVTGYPTVDYERDLGAHGVCFIIDEAGAAGFDAQRWAESDGRSTRGVRCKWYLDQQRKFGDDVFASTNGRSPAGIAKGFRDKAHKFYRLKNNRLASWGIFRGTDSFKAEIFTSEPTAGSRVEPIATEKFHLDEKGLAACYFTEKGVGVLGTGADKGSRARGISVYWVFPLAGLAASLCVFIPYMAAKGTSAALGLTKQSAVKAVPGTRSALPVVDSAAALLGSNAPGAKADKEKRGETETKKVERFASGYLVTKGQAIVPLTDGTTLYSPEVVAVERGGVRLGSGEFVRFRRPLTGAFVPVPSQKRAETVRLPPAVAARAEAAAKGQGITKR